MATSDFNRRVTGAWLEDHDPGDRRFLNVGDLELESGEILPNVIIAYQSWGTLNESKSNAILINHALTGWSDVPGWWPSMVGPGLPFDTDKYFVICPNVIGGCQGNGTGLQRLLKGLHFEKLPRAIQAEVHRFHCRLA